MFTVQRIYAYQPDSKQTAVFIDRLYPRGVHKEVFATALWLKDITPSANLLLDLEKQHGNILLLTAVKDPRHSHVSALAQFLGARFEYRD